MKLQSLKQMVSNSNGFLGINRTTKEIEVQGRTFFRKTRSVDTL